MSEINNNPGVNFKPSVKKADKKSAAKNGENNKPKETQKNEQKPQPTLGSFGIIINKSPSFGASEKQESPQKTKAEMIAEFRQELEKYSYDKTEALEVLSELENGDYSDIQVQRAISILNKSTWYADIALKTAKLDELHYERMNHIKEIFNIDHIEDAWAVNIAGLDDEKFEKFVNTYNNRPDENTYLNTYLNSKRYWDGQNSYKYYSNEYFDELYNIFILDSPLYEQAIDFLDKGIEPVFLTEILKTPLSDKQKEKAEILIKEEIIPTPGIISIDDDLKFNFALSLEKKSKMMNGENVYEDAVLQAVEKYAKDDKTTARLAEIIYKYADRKTLFFYKDSWADQETAPYRSKLLDVVKQIAEFSDEDYKRANEILEAGIPIEYIPGCINDNIQDSQLERLKSMLEIDIVPNFVAQIAANDELYNEYLELSKTNRPFVAMSTVHKNEQARRMEEYIKQGIPKSIALKLSDISGKKLERAKIIYQKKPGILVLGKYLEEKYFERFLYLNSKGCSGWDIDIISNLPDEQYQKVVMLFEKQVSPNIISDIIKFNDEQYQRFLSMADKGYDCLYAKEIALEPEDKYKKITYLMDRGIEYYQIKNLSDMTEAQYNNLIYLLKNGVDIEKAQTCALSQEDFEEQVNKIKSNPNELRDLFNSEEYASKLKKASQSKYQNEIIKMFGSDTMSFKVRKKLIDSGMKEQDFLNAIQKFSKSTFKLAYDTPNQYLSNIDTKYTEKVNGKYPELPEKEKTEEQKRIKNFFKTYSDEILRALVYLDIDTVNQMMDKRTNIFRETLDELNELSDENYQILSNLTKCKSAETGKPLTAKEKIQFSQIVKIYQQGNIDTSVLKKMFQTGYADINAAKKAITEKILENALFSPEEVEELSKQDLAFNKEYMYTMLINDKTVSDIEISSTINYLKSLINSDDDDAQQILSDYIDSVPAEIAEVFNEIIPNIDKYTDEQMMMMLKNAVKVYKAKNDLYVVVRAAITGDFDKFIHDTSNKYGEINQETKKAFETRNINYQEWLKPSIEDVKFEINNKPLTIKMWERNPYEDLFIGNKTSCCTAIGTGSNGAATPAYLLSTVFNVVELYDENDDVVGMSRIFMADIDGKPSVIMDNIELNQNFMKNLNDENKQEVRDNFFKYMNNLAKQVTGDDDSQVYFSTSYLKVGISDLEKTEKTADFTGTVSQESVYLNCHKNWIIPQKLKENPIEFYVVPK